MNTLIKIPASFEEHAKETRETEYILSMLEKDPTYQLNQDQVLLLARQYITYRTITRELVNGDRAEWFKNTGPILEELEKTIKSKNKQIDVLNNTISQLKKKHV